MISLPLAGADSALSGFMADRLTDLEMKFSQEQEKAADLFGVRLVQAVYGDAVGAEAFMQRLAANENSGRLAYYFASHPHPRDRLANIRREIETLKGAR